MKVGLFFGSFNPIHSGHLMLAQFMANFGGVDEVWFVVSPQNPFKQDISLAPAEHRVAMVEIAVRETPRIKVCDIELTLPIPSYTANTLDALEARYPHYEFVLIMGGDNVAGLPRWHRSEEIMKHEILVYPRPNCDLSEFDFPNVKVTDAPQVDISSTMIRKWISSGLDVSHFTPPSVYRYISDNHLYI